MIIANKTKKLCLAENITSVHIAVSSAESVASIHHTQHLKGHTERAVSYRNMHITVPSMFSVAVLAFIPATLETMFLPRHHTAYVSKFIRLVEPTVAAVT